MNTSGDVQVWSTPGMFFGVEREGQGQLSGRLWSDSRGSRRHSDSCENRIQSLDGNNISGLWNDYWSLHTSCHGPVEGVLEMQLIAEQFEDFLQIFRAALKHCVFRRSQTARASAGAVERSRFKVEYRISFS